MFEFELKDEFLPIYLSQMYALKFKECALMAIELSKERKMEKQRLQKLEQTMDHL